MTDRRDAGEPEPIVGLEVLTPRVRVVLLAVAVLVLLGLTVTALVPRTLDQGRTLLATEWQLRAAPRALAPAITVAADDSTEVVRGTRWPGRLQAVQVRLGPDAVAVVGSVPPGADSVRLTTDTGTVHESRLHTLAWHRVHTTVLDGPVTVVEVVAIGADGQVLTVVADLPAARELSRSGP
jgi:NADH:ubiquinone oxidoreductase subunit H